MVASIVICSTDSRRATPCRHVTKIPSPQLLLFCRLENCLGVYQPFPQRNSVPHESGNCLSSTPSDKISSLPTLCRQLDRANEESQRGITMSKNTDANNRMNRPL